MFATILKQRRTLLVKTALIAIYLACANSVHASGFCKRTYGSEFRVGSNSGLETLKANSDAKHFLTEEVFSHFQSRESTKWSDRYGNQFTETRYRMASDEYAPLKSEGHDCLHLIDEVVYCQEKFGDPSSLQCVTACDQRYSCDGRP